MMVSRWAQQQSLIVRRFIAVAVLEAAISVLVIFALIRLLGGTAPSEQLRLPAAFQVTTILLGLGSWFLHRALYFVRLEQQTEFRHSLLAASVTAMLFVSVQSYGLWDFVNATRDFRNPQLNVHGFVFMFTALHGMHFLVAQSVLLWVTLAAFMDRYDHEYYFGVTFAAWFWHALGVAWIAILCVFSIAT